MRTLIVPRNIKVAVMTRKIKKGIGPLPIDVHNLTDADEWLVCAQLGPYATDEDEAQAVLDHRVQRLAETLVK